MIKSTGSSFIKLLGYIFLHFIYLYKINKAIAKMNIIIAILYISHLKKY